MVKNKFNKTYDISSCGYGENSYQYYRCADKQDEEYTLIRYTGIDLMNTLKKLFDEVIFRHEPLPIFRLYDLNTLNW